MVRHVQQALLPTKPPCWPCVLFFSLLFVCLFGGQGLTAQVDLELTLYRPEVQDSLKLMVILLP